MESFGTTLLRLKEISDNALVLAVVMQQSANPNGVVELSDDLLRQAANSLAHHKYTKGEITKAKQELRDLGVILDNNQVRPIDSGVRESMTREQAEKMFHDKIHDDGATSAAPDRVFSAQHTRFYGALLAVHMAPAMMRVKRVPLRDENEDIVLVDGRRQMINDLSWDYGTASKILRDYRIDYVVEACFSIWPVIKRAGAKPPVIDANAADIKDTIQRYKGYLMGVLGRSIAPDEEENELVTLKNY